MKRERRTPTVFSLSMLDVMACGLGAMLLLFIGMVLQIRSTQNAIVERTRSFDGAMLPDLEERLRKGRAETEAIGAQADELKAKRERAQRQLSVLAGEVGHLQHTRALLTALGSPTDHGGPPAPTREIRQIFGSDLDIGWIPNQGRVEVHTCKPETGLARAMVAAGLNLESMNHFDLVALGEFRPRDPDELMDAIHNQDSSQPLDLTVRQDGKETRLKEVHARPIKLIDDEPLPVPTDVKHLLILVQPDRNLNLHLAALIACVLQWHTEIESATILRLGSRPQILTLESGQNSVPRSKLADLVARLPELLKEDAEASPDPLAGLGLLLGAAENARGACALLLLTSPPDKPDALERCIELARNSSATICGIALRGHASLGAAEFLSLLAEQTGGGFLGIAR